ncbi:SseB family protein [Actinomadura sp. NEAU-AAG7]|uniref:SseB family protein n=1 Tax=Actinomadura sp. NEAU-AAG7 TaxID=2839640 RepID=UPI002032A7C7|nr:SseB family protein [Actinomadura sp. NEAU-AAG7]
MLEWSEFARRLGRELAGLERDTILIVRERDESRHYVQAMREPDRLYAEAVSNNFLDGPLLLTPADEEVMSEAGWRPPADPSPRNWWTELPESGAPGGMRSVSLGDYSRLAEVMVTALRDVQGVRRPSDLVYESFHRHGTGLIELLDFGIETADASRVARRRSSAETSGTGTGPLPAGTPPGGTPMPLPPEGTPASGADLLEPRLAEAKAHGDHTTYFDLLAHADPVLPASGSAVEDPDNAELPTITLGSITYVTVFTSPGALARAANPGLYRRTSFALLAAGWPDPSWQLAINPGLPSEVLLDASSLARLSRAPAPEAIAPNPYGNVDPHALSGPNPVAGGSVPSVNGSAPKASPTTNGASYNDDHTAVDSYTLDELRAALESGGVPSGRPAAGGVRNGAVAGQGQDPTVTNTDLGRSVAGGVTGGGLTGGVAGGVAETGGSGAGGADAGGPAAEPRAIAPEPQPEVAPLGAPTDNASGPVPERPAGVPLRPPHGTRLWQSAGAGEETPLAVYDAIGGVWTPVRTDAVPAPHTE